MRITALDRWASSDAGFLHRIPAHWKVLAAALVVAAVVVLWSPWVLAMLAAALLAIAWRGRLPVRTIAGLAAYPLLFSGLLVVTTAYGIQSDAAILLKTYSAALTALTVGFSTPFHQIFGSLGRVLPTFVNDSLLMTYRSMFILADVLSNLLTTVRLRGAFSWRRPITALRDLGFATGNLVLSTFDLAEADYATMRVRGYSGRIRVSGESPAAAAKHVGGHQIIGAAPTGKDDIPGQVR